MSIQPVSSASSTPTGVVLETALNHYEGTEDVSWHVQIEVARASDPTNASPVIQKDSDAAQTGFYWRDDQTDASDRSMVAVPVGGMATKLSLAQPPGGGLRPGHVGVVFYFMTAGEMANFIIGETVFVYSRQSSDGGLSWGDWTARPMVIGGTR